MNALRVTYGFGHQCWIICHSLADASESGLMFEKAQEQRVRLCEPEAALSKALKNRPLIEVLNRVTLILRKMPDKGLFRRLRAIEVLECLATAQARDLLQSLAKEPPDEAVRLQATASLKRLDR